MRSYTMQSMATKAKKSTPAKKQVATPKKASVKKKSATKKVVKKAAPASQKVDFYPNRMTVAVAALAGTLLVLVSLIAVLGVQ